MLGVYVDVDAPSLFQQKHSICHALVALAMKSQQQTIFADFKCISPHFSGNIYLPAEICALLVVMVSDVWREMKEKRSFCVFSLSRHVHNVSFKVL